MVGIEYRWGKKKIVEYLKTVVSHDSIFMEGSKQEKVGSKWVSVGSIFNPINNNFMKNYMILV